MSLNREQKRMLKKRGEIDDDGAPVARKRPQPKGQVQQDRTSPGQFIKEVRQELRKVVWPTRSETINYSIIVLITVTVLTAIVSGLDWVFAELVNMLFRS